MGRGRGDLRDWRRGLDDLAVADVDEGVPGPRLGGMPNELAGQAGAVTDAVTARQDLVTVGRGVRGQARRLDRSRGGSGGGRYVHGDPLLIWVQSGLRCRRTGAPDWRSMPLHVQRAPARALIRRSRR